MFWQEPSEELRALLQVKEAGCPESLSLVGSSFVGSQDTLRGFELDVDAYEDELLAYEHEQATGFEDQNWCDVPALAGCHPS